MSGVRAFLYLITLMVIVVCVAALGAWLLRNTIEPYGNPNR